jgi:hypothetical protein
LGCFAAAGFAFVVLIEDPLAVEERMPKYVATLREELCKSAYSDDASTLTLFSSQDDCGAFLHNSARNALVL